MHISRTAAAACTRRGLVLAVALTLPLAACGSFQLGSLQFGTRTPAAAAPQASLEDDMFLAAALSHTDSEVALARMAETKAKTPSLVAYARALDAERTGLAERLQAAAAARGIGPDTDLTPVTSDFAPIDGTAFERAYVASQLQDQQNDLDSFAFEAAHGANPQLRQLAVAELPRLRQDAERVQAIVKDLPFSQSGDNALINDSMLPGQ